MNVYSAVYSTKTYGFLAPGSGNEEASFREG